MVQLVRLLCEGLIAAIGVALAFEGIRLLRAALERRRWMADRTVADPAAAEVWQVLAEAREITERAARGDAAG